MIKLTFKKMTDFINSLNEDEASLVLRALLENNPDLYLTVKTFTDDEPIRRTPQRLIGDRGG